MKHFATIARQIEVTTGQTFEILRANPVAGGDINSAYRLESVDKSYFVKLNRPELTTMFAAEAAGLEALSKTRAITVPEAVCFGQTSEHSFLVLEYLEFGKTSKTSERLLGQQLAKLHQQPQDFFGWHCDNTIGSTLQLNTPTSDWLSFWRDYRLGFQLQLAAKKAYSGRLQTLGDKLCSDMSVLFAGYQPQPSLLHGDLWAGNVAVNKQGNPIIYDPACYYGDREADLAMTELFGGFTADFYAAYQNIWVLDYGYRVRKTFYNLYHILNHLNLFGGSYLRQAENMMAMLLAESS